MLSTGIIIGNRI